jgi:hypothetical protein
MSNLRLRSIYGALASVGCGDTEVAAWMLLLRTCVPMEIAPLMK